MLRVSQLRWPKRGTIVAEGVLNRERPERPEAASVADARAIFSQEMIVNTRFRPVTVNAVIYGGVATQFAGVRIARQEGATE